MQLLEKEVKKRKNMDEGFCPHLYGKFFLYF